MIGKVIELLSEVHHDLPRKPGEHECNNNVTYI